MTFDLQILVTFFLGGDFFGGSQVSPYYHCYYCYFIIIVIIVIIDLFIFLCIYLFVYLFICYLGV